MTHDECRSTSNVTAARIRDDFEGKGMCPRFDALVDKDHQGQLVALETGLEFCQRFSRCCK